MKCLKCNSELLVDTSVVYTSEPPQYKAECPNCDYSRFIYCKDYIPEENTVEENSAQR